MKKLSRFTKVIILVALAIAVFCVNAGPIAFNKAADKQTAANKKTQISDIFVNEAFAKVTETTEGTGENQGGAGAGGNGSAAESSESASASESASSSETDKPAEPPDARKLIDAISKASTLINSIFNPLILYVTRQIGGLLGNDYIFGGSMGDMLHGIWVVSRNIVNIAFVLILLFLALRHIFGGEENTDLKKTIPLFVIMLIAVNFSWLATRLVLDAANVATNVVFAIPSGVKGVVGKDLDIDSKMKCALSSDNKKVTGGCKPGKMWIPFDATETVNKLDCTEADMKNVDTEYAKAYPSTSKETVKGQTYSFKRTFCWLSLDISKFQQSNAAYYLTYSMANVQNLAVANKGDSISKVGMGTLFSIVIQVVYLIAFISLFIALIFRVAALWILVAFSPFIVLFLFLEKAAVKAGTEGEIKDWLSPGAFVGWAFAPAKVAAVWSVGFIMITAGQTVSSQFFATLNTQGEITSKVFTASSLFMGMETIQEFIWLIMTIGIIWMGTFAVLTKLKVGGQLFEGIKRQGTDLAQWVGRSPQWAPIIPTLEDGKVNWGKRVGLGGMLPSDWTQKIESHYRGEKGDVVHKMAKAGQVLKENLRDNHITDIKNAENVPTRALNAIIEAGKGKIDAKTLAASTPKQIIDVLKESGHFNDLDENKMANLAQRIKDAAENEVKGYPATAPIHQAAAPHTPVPGTLSHAETVTAVEQGVSNALQKEKLTANTADIKTAVGKLKTSKPDMKEEEAIKEAVKNLKNDKKVATAEGGKGAATAGGAGAAAKPKAEPKPAASKKDHGEGEHQ